MPALLRSLKRLRRDESLDTHVDQEPHPKSGATEEISRLLLLIPAEGGFSFRLFPFADLEALRAYLARHEPQHGALAFWALHGGSSASSNAATEAQLEPVVLFRDATRKGLVNLYSFVEMEAAHSFVREEAARGLDLRNVLVYWASSVSIDASAWGTDGAVTDPPAAPQAPPPAAPAGAPKPAARKRAAYDAHAKTALQSDPPRVKLPRRPGNAVAPVPLTPAAKQPDPSDAASPERPPTKSVLGRLAAAIQAWPGWDGLAPLIVRAMLLDNETYLDFDRDRNANGRARLIVSLGILAAVIGAAGAGLTSAIYHLPGAALGWGAYAVTVYAVGTRAFRGRRNKAAFTRLLQALGLANAPAFLLVLGIVPVYGPLFVLAAYMWLLLTTIAATIPTLELDSQSALVAGTTGCMVLFAVSQVMPLLLA